ncbi:MAG: hypothetical protein ACTHJG_02090 [Rhodanobacteraceae bacterium]
MPKQIHEFTAAIQAKQSKIEQCRADIERAGAAAREAERLESEISALSDKRALIKASAFIAGTKADHAEIDRQEAELEKASRKAREDGKAGALAIVMLNESIAAIESEIGDLTEQRKAAAQKWLDQRSEAAIDRYIGALQDLGPILAEAVAADMVRRRLAGDYWPGLAGFFKDHSWNLPIPYEKQVQVPGREEGVRRTPIEWTYRKSLLGDAECGQISNELKEAGVLT